MNENIVGEYQCGECQCFIKENPLVNKIFHLRQILEKSKEFGMDLHYFFVDSKSAYDSIDRHMLLKALKDLKIPDKLIIDSLK